VPLRRTREKVGERQVVPRAAQLAEPGLQLRKQPISGLELRAVQYPALLGRIEHRGVARGEPSQGGGRLAVDELRAELEGDRQIGLPARQDAPTQPVAGFEQANVAPVPRKLHSRRQARRPAADDGDVERSSVDS
jgi:hypothetical protein